MNNVTKSDENLRLEILGLFARRSPAILMCSYNQNISILNRYRQQSIRLSICKRDARAKPIIIVKYSGMTGSETRDTMAWKEEREET